MTRWRKLIGEGGPRGCWPSPSPRGLKTETIKPASLDKVNGDTTVQEKAVTFPTDARLYYKMREKLVAWPKKPAHVAPELPARGRRALIMVALCGTPRS